MVDRWHNLKKDVGEPGKGKGLSRGKGVNRESTKQRERQIFLAGISASLRYLRYTCRKEGCIRSDCELHHFDIRRSQGNPYNHDTRDMGVDDPANLTWHCREHHQELESNPMWTKEATDAYHEEMQRLRGSE